ncbi:transcription elongation factor GreA [Candidatus Absconditicoccus praedator]|uniref:transcription elongation factor GreA n=1 Tax=Candidatus Absconditicoccus praedator TaxID=2735562 RepID=UPI001E59FF39|nr:transcription elongation factor GreA [Candidatus Absconditicoccus praedator]UFX83424.1 transcription elongation factor GreA [Candidatus Absconditicoccus praedator]
MAEEKKYLTQSGYDKLANELEDLKKNKLPEVLERLKEAIAQGDISENAEYDDAMSQKDLIEVRINEIEGMLENVEIIEEGQGGGVVRYGSSVTLEDDKKNVYEFTLVGAGEVDILNGSISFASPVGQAIEGKKAGDTVSVRAPRRRYEMKIVDVK